ncbi:FxSxx-COOH system tetratricopeptide repeat protein [Streptomyces cucumeris]|uniref:FxSxx-COOH system tetratricopeptide repeat protein n=1 Tax=Streptomyces cucumeris TaxID=2962890 RepID=UPI003D7584B6
METVSEAPEKIDFFISYAGVERAWAEWVAWHLQEHGFSVEFDHQHWRAGDNTTARMSDALARSDRFLALLSPSYFERHRYTWDEWTAAYDDRERGPRGFVPLHVAALDKSQIPPLLRPVKAGILHGRGEEEALAELLRAVGAPEAPPARPDFPAAPAPAKGTDAPRLPDAQPKASHVPPRLPLFTGRDDVLDHLRTTFRSRGTVQALHGTGGVGKTQTALEYCHRFGSQYDTVWWLDAEQTVTLDSQLADLAHALEVVPVTMPVADAAQSARQYLLTHGRWLLVFDNAEDPEEFRGLLPDGDGHVLLTSRAPGWHSLAAPVDLGLFAREESRALLAGYLPELPESVADRLAEALGDLPLALAQAGGLIATSGLSAETYLNDLTATSRLLDRNTATTYRHRTLGAAVRISWSHLADIAPLASELLGICAFLAPEPIPLDAWLTNEGVRLPPSLAPLAGDPVAVAEAIGAMARLGLVRIQSGGLTVHRLTAAILRNDSTPEVHEHAKDLVVSVRPSDDGRNPATWQEWAGLLPHVMALGEAWTRDEAMRRLALAATRYLFFRGTGAAAHAAADILHRRWSAELGGGHPDTVMAGTLLSGTLNFLGRYQAALDVIEGVAEHSRSTFVEEDERTLAVDEALAITLGNLGRFEQARTLIAKTLHGYRRTLGEYHPGTLGTIQLQAGTMGFLGHHKEARVLLREIVDRSRVAQGEDHPDTLIGSCSLAMTLNHLDKHAQAQAILEDTLGRSRAVLGDDHPVTLHAAQCLASTLACLGHHVQARAMLRSTLEQGRAILGDDHLSTLIGAQLLASLLNALGQSPVALALLQEGFERSRATLGDDHPNTLNTAALLGDAMGCLGRRKEARALLQDTLERSRRTLGEAHPQTRNAARLMERMRRRSRR